MPVAATWARRIAQIRKEVEAYSVDLSRRDVERIFRVGETQALGIMSAAGGRLSEVRGKILVSPESLLAYLKYGRAGQEAEREAARQQKVAQQVAEMDARHQEEPPLLVTTVPRPVAREIDRGGLEHPPAGITIEPGRIEIRFDGAVDALDKLKRLALLIALHEAEFAKWADEQAEAGKRRAG
jgi:hypothetical protein